MTYLKEEFKHNQNGQYKVLKLNYSNSLVSSTFCLTECNICGLAQFIHDPSSLDLIKSDLDIEFAVGSSKSSHEINIYFIVLMAGGDWSLFSICGLWRHRLPSSLRRTPRWTRYGNIVWRCNAYFLWYIPNFVTQASKFYPWFRLWNQCMKLSLQVHAVLLI